MAAGRAADSTKEHGVHVLAMRPDQGPEGQKATKDGGV
jgi:hypothetical protein